MNTANASPAEIATKLMEIYLAGAWDFASARVENFKTLKDTKSEIFWHQVAVEIERVNSQMDVIDH